MNLVHEGVHLEVEFEYDDDLRQITIEDVSVGGFYITPLLTDETLATLSDLVYNKLRGIVEDQEPDSDTPYVAEDDSYMDYINDPYNEDI